MNHVNGLSTTDLQPNCSPKENEALPRGSASSLATINNLAKRLTANTANDCAEWAKEIEKLSARLLADYKAQNGFARQ